MLPPTAPGDLLRAHRQRRGLSLREAARRSGGNHTYWGAVERGRQPGRERVWPTRAKLVEMTGALDLTLAERDELLVAFGYEPVGQDAARRKLEEAAELLGMTPAQRDRLLAFAGVTSELAPSGQSGHDAAASDPAPGVRTAGVAFDRLPPEDQEAILRLARSYTTAADLDAPGPTQGGVDGESHAAHGGPAGRGRRAAGGDQ